jgi:uncharacterized membrane protein
MVLASLSAEKPMGTTKTDSGSDHQFQLSWWQVAALYCRNDARRLGRGRMTTSISKEDADRLARLPVVQKISFADIGAALAAGWRDFLAHPAYGLFFGAVYAAGGLLVVGSVIALNMAYFAYPLVAGFALIGPFVAVGLYEVSRRRERGEPLSWGGVLGVINRSRRGELTWMAFAMLFALVVWMYQVRLLIAFFMADSMAGTLADFVTQMVTTPNGLLFLALGHGIGAVLSLLIFAITVVSVPMLLDRDVDFITAMIASVKAVTTSPLPMIAYGAAVVLALLAACVPAFLGLLIVLPVLGHTTWHLYRRAIAPARVVAL